MVGQSQLYFFLLFDDVITGQGASSEPGVEASEEAPEEARRGQQLPCGEAERAAKREGGRASGSCKYLHYSCTPLIHLSNEHCIADR